MPACVLFCFVVWLTVTHYFAQRRDSLDGLYDRFDLMPRPLGLNVPLFAILKSTHLSRRISFALLLRCVVSVLTNFFCVCICFPSLLPI